MNVISQFIDVLSAAGYRPVDGKILPDDRVHRLYYGEEKHSSGRYSLCVEGDFAFGWFFSDKDPQGRHDWHSKSTERQTPEERKAAKKRIAEARRRAEEKRNRYQARLADRLTKLVRALPKAEAHPYLTAKGVAAHGLLLRAKGNELIVPMRGEGGRVWSVQKITPSGGKFFIAGGRVKAGYFPIATGADSKETLVICEGFATGASIREATGLPVVVAFNAGNLLPVAEALRVKYPDARFIFAADNDQWTNQNGTPHNPGLEKARAAAKATDGQVIYPTVDARHPARPTDFNDIHKLEGLDAVRAAFNAPEAVEEQPPMPDEVPDYGEMEAEPQRERREPAATYGALFDNAPFRLMGHNQGVFYYFSKTKRQIISCTAKEHSRTQLYELAPHAWWELWQAVAAGMPSETSKAEKWALTCNALMQASFERGVCRPEGVVRGSGAWIDEGRPVLHCGDKVYIGRDAYDPYDVPSRYVYEASERLLVPSHEHVTAEERRAFIQICTMPTWEHPLSGPLLAGWLVIAPICSALKWRPHIWITGPTGSGKSTISDLIHNVLGPIALKTEGGTTEAALRQTLGKDGRPIIVDEAEAEDQKMSAGMQAVLNLARKASSGGTIIKGTPNGAPITFIIRSCFCFLAINSSVKHLADESRISHLAIRKNDAPDAREHFARLTELIDKTITPEFTKRLLARTVDNMPVLLKNITHFSRAAAGIFGSARAADQMGPLLAGFYLLHSSAEVTAEGAAKWIKEHPGWDNYTTISASPDHERLVAHICTSKLRVQSPGGVVETPIGTLIRAAQGIGVTPSVDKDKAQAALRGVGIRVQHDGVIIAQQAAPLAKLLVDTPWASRWHRPLMDIKGARQVEKTTFIGGLKSRGVLIPLTVFEDDDPTPAPELPMLEEEFEV
jgi:putative DNA primase/helicase